MSVKNFRSFTSNSRPNISTVLTSTNPNFCSSTHVLCTCSTHGENEHKTPSSFKQFALLSTHLCGPGKSKNTASAIFAVSKFFGNPFVSMSRCVTVQYSFNPFSSISSLAASARDWLNSNVNTCPLLTLSLLLLLLLPPPRPFATALTSECVKLALPVPLSNTTFPGFKSNHAHINDMSYAYNICVRCANTFVQSSHVGAKHQTNGF